VKTQVKDFDAKIQRLAGLIQNQTKERLDNETKKTNPNLLIQMPDFNVVYSQTKIVPGRKYTKIDIYTSGRYMVVNETGQIFGIKAYGVIHKGHYYGTLDTIDNYYWGGYTAYKKG
jgi:hypothetical protein